LVLGRLDNTYRKYRHILRRLDTSRKHTLDLGRLDSTFFRGHDTILHCRNFYTRNNPTHSSAVFSGNRAYGIH
jgi:hypothetical protein